MDSSAVGGACGTMRDAQQGVYRDPATDQGPPAAEVSRSIEWYSEGQERVVEAGDVRLTVRFVGRNGRRARIAITAPPGATFLTPEERRDARPNCGASPR